MVHLKDKITAFAVLCCGCVDVQVDQWLDTSTQIVSGLSFEVLCGRLNDYLSMRSFFVGFTTTAADFAIWGQLHGEGQQTHKQPNQLSDAAAASRHAMATARAAALLIFARHSACCVSVNLSSG